VARVVWKKQSRKANEIAETASATTTTGATTGAPILAVGKDAKGASATPRISAAATTHVWALLQGTCASSLTAIARAVKFLPQPVRHQGGRPPSFKQFSCWWATPWERALRQLQVSYLLCASSASGAQSLASCLSACLYACVCWCEGDFALLVLHAHLV
jgi:hypothetical protein